MELYIQNPQKTENPAFYDHREMDTAETQGMRDLLDYAMEDTRADEIKRLMNYTMDNEKTNMQHYVSGVNCSPDTARMEMLAVKKHYQKEDGNVAYHAIQAFQPGETNPDMAHAIGVKLAEELWGTRFQVIVATHLDHGHLHNHFLLNSVSVADGKKYNDCKATYRHMREVSDRLCAAHSLSILQNPRSGKGKHYGEWRAEQEGRPTYRGSVKADVDTAIRDALTEKQFYSILRSMGYDFKFGQDITILAKGRERGLKLERNFGPAYSIERIRKRILEQRTPAPQQKQQLLVVQYHFRGSLQKTCKLHGFKALYISYMFKMGILPKARRQQQNKPRHHLLFREDLLKIRQYDEELRLLLLYPLDTQKQLSAFLTEHKEVVSSLSAERKKLTNHLRFVKTDTERLLVKQQISELTTQITKIRKEVKAGERIGDRVPLMREKLHAVQHDEWLALQPQQEKKGRTRT